MMGRAMGVVFRQNVRGLCFLVEMQFHAAAVKLTQNQFDALLYRSMVGTVAGDELLDDGAQCEVRN